MSECESEPVSELVSVFGSAFGPESWFVCVCELAASAWLGAVEIEARLPRDDYRGERSCSGTEARPHYWGLSVQWDGSPDVKQVDTVRAAGSRQGVSEPALEEMVAGWEWGWAVAVTGPVEEEEEAAVLEKASVAVAGIAQ